MNRTKIEWVKNPDGTQGYTWNPITGCLNGCEYCYARKLANGRLKARYLNNCHVIEFHSTNIKAQQDPFYPRFWTERLIDPNTNLFRRHYIAGEHKGIFVCDMGELFGDWVPKEWQDKIFDVIHRCPQHRFYLLTKQPQNLIKFSPFPENCWVGVTATDESMFHNASYYLEKVSALVKFMSLEPLLSFRDDGFNTERLKIANIKQIIIGAQTKPYKPPKIEWVEEIVRACNKAGIPVFLKDNLKPFLDTQPTRIVYQYGSGKLRQEMPK